MDNDIKKLDFNLLKLFSVLMETRSVSGAADQLNITQSATSHALKRLREAFSDTLFVATKEGMIPTPRAVSAQQTIEEAINLIDQALNRNRSFDPESSNRSFIIMASDYFELVILPELVCFMEERAKNCKIEIISLKPEVPVKALQIGRVDLMIGFSQYFKLDPNLLEEPLLSDRLVCAVGQHNTDIGEALTLDQYLKRRHIYPSPWGDSHNMVDSWLSKKTLSRDICITVQNYLSTPMLVAKSNCLLTLPERVFHAIKHTGPIRMVEPPEQDYPKFVVNMLAHRLFENEPGNRWLRSAILEVCQRL